MQPWNIAHRGGAGINPENTLPAFADAVARGCDGAELDVQVSWWCITIFGQWPVWRGEVMRGWIHRDRASRI
jgi:hypothetical protein